MIVQDLHSLKYIELQKLAKCVGIRANQKIDKLIKALTNHYVESESMEKDESTSKEKVPPVQRNTKKESSSVAKSSPTPSVKALVEKKLDESKIQTPNQTGGRKRRRTFELDEASIQGNTPTIDGQTEKPTRQDTPHRVSSGSKKNTDMSNKQHKSTFNKSSLSISESDTTKSQTPTQSGGRKRRRTFELDEASLQGSTPTIDGQSEKQTKHRNSREASAGSKNCSEHVSKRQCRGTFNKDLTSSQSSNKSSESSSSPGTKAIIEAMDANCSSFERREKLLSVINKKVQNTVSSTASSKSSQTSLIPRFATFVLNKKKEAKKAVTPGNKDWRKIHKKEFSKFDSIDVYLEKKKQRQDVLSASAKKALPFGSSAGRAKPTIVKPVSKNRGGGVKIFQPQVTSVKNLNFNFSKKASTSKTPSRQPITPARGTTPAASHKSSMLADKAIAGKATPFTFIGNSSISKQAAPSKLTFDLKASLARPMTWKPHTGKFQPVDTNKEQSVQTQRQKGPTAHRNLARKTRSAKVKTVHRAAVVDRRLNQKYVDMMKKRGLLV